MPYTQAREGRLATWAALSQKNSKGHLLHFLVFLTVFIGLLNVFIGFLARLIGVLFTIFLLEMEGLTSDRRDAPLVNSFRQRHQ